MANRSKDLIKCANDLENAFFLEEDQKLIDKLREMKRLEETKQNLSRVSGIKNDRILQKLVDLDIHAEILAALSVVPLIEVAWADGSVDRMEKEAILKAIDLAGIREGDPRVTLVEQWLTHRPEPALLEAWTHYIEGLSERLSDQELKIFRDGLMAQARGVAEAAGGFLGLTSKISKEESKMLEELAATFGG
jgi:hypothetical protein